MPVYISSFYNLLTQEFTPIPCVIPANLAKKKAEKEQKKLKKAGNEDPIEETFDEETLRNQAEARHKKGVQKQQLRHLLGELSGDNDKDLEAQSRLKTYIQNYFPHDGLGKFLFPDFKPSDDRSENIAKLKEEAFQEFTKNNDKRKYYTTNITKTSPEFIHYFAYVQACHYIAIVVEDNNLNLPEICNRAFKMMVLFPASQSPHLFFSRFDEYQQKYGGALPKPIHDIFASITLPDYSSSSAPPLEVAPDCVFRSERTWISVFKRTVIPALPEH